MGAWGVGSFDNDESRDWLANLRESPRPGWRIIDHTLRNARTKETSDELRAVAAAEIVAVAAGHSPLRIPTEAIEIARTLGTPPASIVTEAHAVIGLLINESELKELFENDPDWLQEMESLRQRLFDAQNVNNVNQLSYGYDVAGSDLYDARAPGCGVRRSALSSASMKPATRAPSSCSRDVDLSLRQCQRHRRIG